MEINLKIEILIAQYPELVKLAEKITRGESSSWGGFISCNVNSQRALGMQNMSSYIKATDVYNYIIRREELTDRLAP